MAAATSRSIWRVSVSSGPATLPSACSRSVPTRRRRPLTAGAGLSSHRPPCTLLCCGPGAPGLAGWRAARGWPGDLDDHEFPRAVEAQRHLGEPELSRLDPVRADLRLVKADLPGLPPGDHVEKPLSVPPFAARRRSKISTAHSGTSASASVLTAGAGNHSARSSPPKSISPRRRASHRPASDQRWPAPRPTGSRSPRTWASGPRASPGRAGPHPPTVQAPTVGSDVNQPSCYRQDKRRRREFGDLRRAILASSAE